MDFIGFDLGKVSSQVCIITEDGELIERHDFVPLAQTGLRRWRALEHATDLGSSKTQPLFERE